VADIEKTNENEKIEKTEKSKSKPKQSVKKTDADKAKEKKANEKGAKKAAAAKKSKRSPLKWFREARSEFKKVTWPTPKQVVKNTGVVLVMLTIAGLAIWGVDLLLEYIFGLILIVE